MAWVKRGRRWIYVRDEAPRRKRKPAAAPKRKPTGVLSTAERAKASRTTRRRASTPGTREYRASNRRLRTRARELGIPTRGPLGRVPTTVLRSQVRSAERTRRQIARTTARSKRRSSTPGILRRGLIGSAVYELTGKDISDDVRRVLYGSDSPSAADLALAVIPGAGLLRGGRTAARGAAAAARGIGRALRTADEATSIRGLARIARGRRPAPPRASRRTARKTAQSRPRRALRVAGGVARAGARAATFPIRRPIKTAKYSIAAQAPVALATGDPLGEAKRALEGTGAVGQALGAASQAARDTLPVVGNLVGDFFDLPANIVPSAYLTGTAIAEAIGGDSTRLENMWRDFTEGPVDPQTGQRTGVGAFLPELLTGQFGDAARAFAEHPLYSALEARGLQAAVGRTAGAVARHAPSERLRQIGSQERKPLRLPGGLGVYERRYSPDLIEKAVQMALDRRRRRKYGGQRATPREAERILNEKVDRIVAREEGVRRANRARELEGAERSLRQVTGRLRDRRIPRDQRDAISLAVQGIVRNPEAFAADLLRYGQVLDRAHARMAQERAQATTRYQRRQISQRMKKNRQMKELTERLLTADPEAIFRAARENVQALRAIERELVEYGVLDPRQAQQARLMPFARVHLDADYGRSAETQARIERAREARRLQRRVPRLQRRVASERARVREIERQERDTPSRRERRLQQNIKRERAEAERRALRTDEELVTTERRVRELRRRERRRRQEAAYLRGRLERLEREDQSRGRREEARKAAAEHRKRAEELRARIAARQRQADRLRGRLERLEAEERARARKAGTKEGKPKRDVREITKRTRNALLGAEADLKGLRAELRAVERKAKVAERDARKRPIDPKKASALTNRTRQKLLDAEADLRGLRAEIRALEGKAKVRAREVRQAARAAEPSSQRRLIKARAARRSLAKPSARLQRRREALAALEREMREASARARTLREAERVPVRTLARREQLIDAEGRALPPERLESIRQEMGAEPTAFVSQSPRARGARSFYRAFFPDRASVAKAKRTGKATEDGTFDPSFDALVEQRVRGRGIVDAIKGFDRTVREFAVGGRFRNWQEAQDAAQMFERRTGIAVRPMRLSPLHANSREARRAEEIFDAMDTQNQRALEGVTERLLREATTDGPGPVVLVPEAVYKRLQEHFQAATVDRRVMQVVTNTFKGVVLPTSPNWFLGNLIDVSMRSMLSGTIPWGRDARLGRRIVREYERMYGPEEAARLRAALLLGMNYSAAESTRVFRDARQFAGTRIAPLARALGALRRSPGVKQVVNTYVRYRDAAFHFNEKFLERQSQYAQLGKAARREVRQTTGKWHKALVLGDEAIRDLAKGLRETDAQIRYAKQIEDVLGKWTANSPTARRFLVDYTPFGMWARAATKFVLVTLPARHPIKTSIAAMLGEYTREEREALGLTPDAQRALPPDLQGSIPLPGGRLAPVQTLSTFGFFADYQQSLATMVLPQFPLDELRRYDWTGRELRHEDGTRLLQEERALVALLSFGEAMVPFVAMGKRIADQGPIAALPRAFRPMPPDQVQRIRDRYQARTITVPVGGGGGPAAGPPTSSSAPAPTVNPYVGVGGGGGPATGPPTSSSAPAPTVNPYVGLGQ